jgi:hypothetical protein
MKMNTMVRLTLANNISFFFDDDDEKAEGCDDDEQRAAAASCSTLERPLKVNRFSTIRRTKGPSPMKTKFIQMQ